MKFTRKNILSFVLSLVMMFAVFAGVAPVKASAANFKDTVVSSVKLYNSGCLKEITMTIQAAPGDKGSYAEAHGRIALHKNENPTYTYKGTRFSLDGTSWPADESFLPTAPNGDPTFIAFAKLPYNATDFLWTNMDPYTSTFSFDDGIIDLFSTTEKTYRVYLWSRSEAHGIYTEDKTLATLTVGNGELKLNSSNLITAPTVYNITLDRDNYAGNSVVLHTFNSTTDEESTTNTHGGTIPMPEGGKVVVTADEKFEATVNGTKCVAAAVAGGGYQCEFTGITAAATVKVTSIYDITLDDTYCADESIEFIAYDRNGTKIDETTAADATVTIPFGGKVKVKSDVKFRVAVETAQAAVTPISENITATYSQDGEYYYCEISGVLENKTVKVTSIYDITLNDANYAGEFVEFISYDSNGTKVDEATATDATVTMPFGGKVVVTADEKFEAVLDESASVGIRQDRKEYVITDITADTTVTVSSIYDITFDRTNYAGEWVSLYAYRNEDGTGYIGEVTANNGVITIPNGGSVKVFAGDNFTVTAEGATVSELLDAGEEGLYYIITGITKDTTVTVNRLYDITFRKGYYPRGNVELFTYDSNNELVASTEKNGATVVMPENGTVSIVSDKEFTAEVNDTIYSSEAKNGAYSCVISNITSDVTVIVEKVKHVHIWGYNTQYDAAVHWDHCHICGALSSLVAHSDPDGDGYCVCGWPISTTENTTVGTDTTVDEEETTEDTTTENRKDEVPDTGHGHVAVIAFLTMVLSGSSIVFYSKRKNAFNKEN